MTELEQENADLRVRLNRMEAEMAALRAAVTKPTLHPPHQYITDTEDVPETGGQQLASPAPSAEVSCETCVLGKDCVCLNVTATEIAPPISKRNEDGCGLCSEASCICEDLGIRDKSTDATPATATSTPHPAIPHGIKRKRSSYQKSSPLLPVSESFPMEIDFTTAFSNNSSPSSNTGDGLPRGGCGFCTVGTPCVCLPNTLPPLQAFSAPITPHAHPEALRRNGGRKPRVDDMGLVGGSVPLVGSPRTIGNGGCTRVPGNSCFSPDSLLSY